MQQTVDKGTEQADAGKLKYKRVYVDWRRGSGSSVTIKAAGVTHRIGRAKSMQ